MDASTTLVALQLRWGVYSAASALAGMEMIPLTIRRHLGLNAKFY